MKQKLISLCLLPILAFGHWVLDFDEDFAAASAEKPDVTDGLVAWWNFDEGAGTSVKDYSGTNTATLYGECVWTNDSGAALYFGGGTAFADIPSLYSFNSQSFTVSFWMKANGPQGDYCHFGPSKFYNANAASFGLNTDIYRNQNLKVYVYNGSGINQIIYTSLLNGNWRHVLYTSDSTTLTAYLDGAQINSSVIGGTIPYNAGAFRINDYNSGLRGICFMRNVRLYTRALSSNEVTTIYNRFK